MRCGGVDEESMRKDFYGEITAHLRSLCTLLLLFLLAGSAGADLRGVGPRVISVTAHNGFEIVRLTGGLTVQDELRALAGRATLSDLRWPDYSDYLLQVQRFYEPTGYAPAWIENTKPTPQAQAMLLSGSAGFGNSSISSWFTWPSRFWSVGPSLAETIFDAGLRRATVQQFRANYDQTVANYR